MDGITDSMDMNLSKLHQMTKDREGSSAAVHGVAERQTEQQRKPAWRFLGKLKITK